MYFRFHKEISAALIILFLLVIFFYFIYKPLFLIFLILLIFTFYFFRDPERVVPLGDDILVSPADGLITNISEYKEGKKSYTKVSIFLSVFNVHIQRLPVSGQITKIDYKRDINLREVDCVKGFVMFINHFECKSTNYFDENFFLYLEEVDLCKRLKKMGKKIYIAENVMVKHLGGKSHHPDQQEKMEIQRNWHYLWSLFYYSKKHKGLIYAYKITLRKFFSAFFKMIYYFFLNKKKHVIYKYRFLGLLNSYIGKSSFFRVE